MAMPALKNEGYTYEEYQHWPDSERWEIIDGEAYDMSPAPLIRHQRIKGNLFHMLKNSIDRKCPVFDAPTDVVFDEYNVVQPDVFAVCDRSIITEKNIQGAPVLIVEVISPSTSLKDRREKKNLYEQFGVREYILVFPDDCTVERYVLKKGSYGAAEIFNWDEELPLASFDVKIALWEIFEKEKEAEKSEPLIHAA